MESDAAGAAAVEVRAARADQTARVLAVVPAAFGEGDEGERVARLARALIEERGPAAPLRASLVASQASDDVVGHVALTRGWVDAERRLVEVLVLSPLSVHPDHQRRGTGRLLVEAAVAEADRLGSPLLLLEGDPAYYGRLGFEPAAQHRLERPSSRIPAPACQVRLLSSYEEWMTGALVYPDVFWRHDCVGLRPSSSG